MSQGSNGKESGSAKILVGLGNPGDEYAGTYHNVGVAAVFGISGGGAESFRRAGGKPFRYFKNDDVIFVIPETYMNESGPAVKAALDYFGAGVLDLILIHDDSDIEAGAYKITIGRGSAGHKGVKSAFEALGTDEFTRVRIGIRGKSAGSGEKRKKADEFVLKRILKQDWEKIKETFPKIKLEIFG